MKRLVLKFCIFENTKEAIEYFQIIDANKSKVYSFNDKKYTGIEALNVGSEIIDFIYESKRFSIKKGDKIQLAQFENGLLVLEWITNEDFINGLCYEVGFEKENKDFALETYYQYKDNLDCLNGLYRIINSDYLYGSKVGLINTKIDDVKMAILYMKVNKFDKVYDYLKYRIPKRFNHKDIEIGDNNVNDIRKLITIEVIRHFNRYLYNDSQYFNCIYPMLATFYDDINNVTLNDRKVYYKVTEEKDHYDGGTRDIIRIYGEAIAETLQSEALKKDPLAIGGLITYLSKYINNEFILVEELENIAHNGDTEDKALASFFLGKYYHDSNVDKSNYYFELAIKNGSIYHKI